VFFKNDIVVCSNIRTQVAELQNNFTYWLFYRKKLFSKKKYKEQYLSTHIWFEDYRSSLDWG